jgi:DNA-binding Lrp family transcriptional regulator
VVRASAAAVQDSSPPAGVTIIAAPHFEAAERVSPLRILRTGRASLYTSSIRSTSAACGKRAGRAVMVAAALRDLPGVSETGTVAGPNDVIARAQAPDIDELGKLVATRVRALDGVTRTLTCTVVHL